MNTHEIIIKILRLLENSLDDNELDVKRFSSKELGISKTKRVFILEMMQDVHLIKGIRFQETGRGRGVR